MSDQSARLSLPFIMPAQAQKHVTHNEALLRLDMLVQLSVEAFEATEPPNLPQEGQIWALGLAPSGVWAEEAGKLAAWVNGGWFFIAPQSGWRATMGTELRIWDGAGWVSNLPDLQNIDGIGVNTSSDGVNRLAVSSEATLLTHEGAGHQLKINKAGPTDTASLLFQSGWSGRAEMGLAGSDTFEIKVSADGTAWKSGLTIAPDTGRAGIVNGLTLSGTLSGDAVTQAGDDGTEGRVPVIRDAGGIFGLGGRIFPVSGQNISVTDNSIRTGLYLFDAPSGDLGGPDGVVWGHLVHMRRASGGGETQLMVVEDAVGGYGLAQGDLLSRSRIAGAWSPWRRMLTTNGMVGTVAQSGGVPMGAVIESGSNANGYYVRFADGTQICRRTIAVDVQASGVQVFPFPASFVGGREDISASFSHRTGAPNPALRWPNLRATAHTTTAWAIALEIAGTSSTPQSDAESMTVSAFGRWF